MNVFISKALGVSPYFAIRKRETLQAKHIKARGGKKKKREAENASTNAVKIRSLVPVKGNKSLPLICSPAELVGPISRVLSWCPLKPQHCISYLGLIGVCPPRDGSMAAGPSPTLNRPLLGSPLAAWLACFTLRTLFLSLSFTLSPSYLPPVSWNIFSDKKPQYVTFECRKTALPQDHREPEEK